MGPMRVAANAGARMNPGGRPVHSTHDIWRRLVDRKRDQVCERWIASYQAFLEDMGERPRHHRLVRARRFGLYDKGNCSWVFEQPAAPKEKKARPVSAARTIPVRQCASSNNVPDFPKILEGERKRLRVVARMLARDSDTADDLVQETIIRAWQAREQFKVGTNMAAWLNTILRNYYFSQYRRTKCDAKYGVLTMADIDYVGCHGAATVDADVLVKRIQQLSPEHREILIAFSTGARYETLAAELRIPCGTFKSRLNRARQALIDGGALL